jgi:hypothetical protein
MTHSFKCPSCGAPLVTRGSAPALTCPYCGTSVIVPDSLRQTDQISHWSTRLYENFRTQDNGWVTDELGKDDFFVYLRRSIKESRYRWEAQSNTTSSSIESWLISDKAADFHVMANVKYVSGSRDGASYGLVFRLQDGKNYNLFKLANNQYFQFCRFVDGAYTPVVGWTQSDLIKPYGVNQLEVIGRGSHFSMLINGQGVCEADDSTFERGMFGLSLTTYNLNDPLVVDFLDFTLRVP